METEMVEISKERYEELLEKEQILDDLNSDIDSWDWRDYEEDSGE